jgi:hypothetical protein
MELYIHPLFILSIKILFSKLIFSALIHPLYHPLYHHGPTRQFFFIFLILPPTHSLSPRHLSHTRRARGAADLAWSDGGPRLSLPGERAATLLSLSPARARAGLLPTARHSSVATAQLDGCTAMADGRAPLLRPLLPLLYARRRRGPQATSAVAERLLSLRYPAKDSG